MELATKRYIGGVPRHLSVSGKSSTVCPLCWRRSLAKAPLYRALSTRPTAHRLLTSQVDFHIFYDLAFDIFGVQNAIRYAHRARATPTPPSLELIKTAAYNNTSHRATTYPTEHCRNSQHTMWLGICMRQCDALRAP